MQKKIEELAYLRNKLLINSFDDKDISLLHTLREKIISLDTPFKEISICALNNCEISISEGKNDLAVCEIQLIHNFTYFDTLSWDSDYFYRVELLSYFENIEDVERVKKLIKNLAKLQDIIFT